MIEAIEAEDGHFVLGVQWHAETLVGEAEQLALFERLVDAAGAPRQKSSDAQKDSGAHAL
jgi:gamma-glutamyl-gamma-aminobutyrate hydrolase PuuD